MSKRRKRTGRTAQTGLAVDGYQVMVDPAAAARALGGDTVVGVDLETTGFNHWDGRIATVQLYGDESGTAALIRTPDGRLPAEVKEVLEDPKHLMVVHNGVGFDIPFLHSVGVDPDKGRWYDTLVAETAIVPTQRRDVSKSLKASVKRRLGMEVDKDVQRSDWSQSALTQEQVAYAMRDVFHLPALRRSQLELAEERGVAGGLQVEMDLVVPTAWMTINGLPIGLEKLGEYLARQEKDRKRTAKAFKTEFGELNTRSPKQVKDAFLAKGIEVPDTRKETMLDLVTLVGGEAGRLANILLEFRRPDQRLKVYGGDWADRFVRDGRVHSHFWQCSTDTTRYSSSNPNLEQIPRDMRHVFGWLDGHLIVALDYSQIEIRVAAAYAEDAVLLAALDEEDVHASIAAEIFDIPLSKVTFDQRKLAKAMSFTLLFGGGPQVLYDYARRGGGNVTFEQAQAMVARFFDRFSGLAEMKQRAIQKANYSRMATVRLPSGLKRQLFGQQLKPTTLLNTLVQGSAASGIKFGILEAHRRGLVAGYLGNQVHDELVSTVPAGEAKEYAAEAKEAMVVGMTQAVDCRPRVEVKIDKFWKK